MKPCLKQRKAVVGRAGASGRSEKLMFNSPEWASTEEWDAYAWFGFALSEAQVIERQLLVIAVAISTIQEGVSPSEATWSKLYDDLGRLTFGRLLSRIRQHPMTWRPTWPRRLRGETLLRMSSSGSVGRGKTRNHPLKKQQSASWQTRACSTT